MIQLQLNWLDWLIGSAALLCSIVLGLHLSLRLHKQKTSADYFLAGRKVVWQVVGASLFSATIGAEHLVGLTGDAYRYGLSAGTVELATAICLGFTCWILAPTYIKNKIYTVPEMLELRYSSTARYLFSGYSIVICVVTKMAFTFFAGALVLHSVLGWDIMTTIIMLGVVTGIFTMWGGFAGVVFTDTIQSIIMLLAGIAMLWFGLERVGGWDVLVQKAPEALHIVKSYDDKTFPFWGVILGAFYGGITHWGIDQVNAQRMLAAKDLDHARWGMMFAGFLKLTPVFIFALPGVIAYAIVPDLDHTQAKLTFVVMLNEMLPHGLRGLALAGLIAAIVSSLFSIMNSMSTLVVRDFTVRLQKNVSERKQIFLGRILVLIVICFGIFSAYFVFINEEGIHKYLQTISIYLQLPVFAAVFFGIASKHVTSRGAQAAVITGVILSSIFIIDDIVGVARGEHLFPWLHHKLTENYTYRGLWGNVIIISILFTVSAFTEKTHPAKLAKSTVNWKAPREKWAGFSDWRLHLGALLFLTTIAYAIFW